MIYVNLLLEIKDNVGIITINRPKALNALNIDTINELISALKEYNADKNVRVIVVTGAGEKAFVAGADITSFPKMGRSGADQFAHIGHDLMRAIESASKPVIAAVNGFALGGGTELALACDFIYAADTAVFGLPEVSLGIFPGFGGTQRLNKNVGLGFAREMIFTGRKIPADEALRVGLANKVVPANELSNAVIKCAQEIAANSPVAIAAVKNVINRGATLPLNEGLAIERTKFAECFDTLDMKEGVAAFLERRKPVWK
ncbi:MAG: enoyl-CoA hydratase/isomerase family protein [Deltaproteobacteria bacterium]|nr:enoyl-CoA hydratase/isomerase family protein [Deltaproteobacteria bacterium]